MADAPADDAQEQLKAALWYAVGKIVDEETMRQNRNATPQFTGALTEMVWMQIESAAMDLEAFAKHAGRTTVTADDVMLLTRRNDDLRDIVQEAIDEEKAAAAKKTAKGKAKAKA